MDHAGAIIGPLAATFLLAYFTSDLRTVFWLAAYGNPAILLIIFKVKEVERKVSSDSDSEDISGRLRTYLIILSSSP
jgi:hypothetical protein